MAQPVGVEPLTSPELDAAILEHAYRGVRLQLLVRALLVGFIALTVSIVPPVHAADICYAVLAGYAVFAAAVAWWAHRARLAAVRVGWRWLFVDLAVLAALTLLTGVAAEQSWTSYVLINGLFLIPMLAASQLRPGICAAVVVPTVLVYLAASLASQGANQEPTESIALRTLVLAGVGTGCVALSVIQRSRVRTIGRLLSERTALLAELVGQEARERRALSEQLHDGALQYLLAARQDLDELRDRVGPGTGGSSAEPAAFARLDEALTESARLLRSTVTELHPSVLEHAGLARSIRELARTAGSRAGLAVTVDLDGWPEELRTPADQLLFSTARELLNNVVKHAHAHSAHISLARRDGTARLVIADDGRGIRADAAGEAAAHGHIGLRSHQVRAEAAGGRLTVVPASPTGTAATLELPLEDPNLADVQVDEPRIGGQLA